MKITKITPRTGVCPRCKIVPIIKVGKYGPLPHCAVCLMKSVRGRYDRRNERVRGTRNGHYDAEGNRYPDRFIPSEATCHYCKKAFTRDSKSNGRAVCQECLPLQFEEKRKKQTKRAQRLYQHKPEQIKLRRIKAMCKRAGLPDDWYEQQPKVCGICGTNNPGGKQGWCIDHNHLCCPYGTRQGCANCIRGLLCNKCNRGLGYFCDDPTRLRKAIEWVTREREQVVHQSTVPIAAG